MRRVFCALLVLALAWPAAAADLEVGFPPALQTVGPATFTRWSGFYFGGQFGLSNGNADFSNATQPLIAYVLRDTLLEDQQVPSHWPVLGTADNHALGYGGFVGYNTQWQDLILGVEANYNRAALSLNAPASPIARTTTDNAGNAYAVGFTGSGSLAAENFATLRLRGGWVAGSFLPYGYVGFAAAVATTSISTTGMGVQYPSGTVGVCAASPSCVPFSINNSFNANSQVLYGFTVGGGVDVAVTQNIFLRAEFEYDQFNPPPGFFMHVATGRVGAGLKF